MFDGYLSTSHPKFMQEALKLAKVAYQNDEIPIGAVVVLGNQIIGKGYNQVEMHGDATAHAEMIAISAACSALDNKYLINCTLYVTVEPCMMCAGAAVWSKVGRIVFGAMDEKAGGAGSVFNIASNRKLNHRAEIIQGVMEGQCSALLKQFFNERRA